MTKRKPTRLRGRDASTYDPNHAHRRARHRKLRQAARMQKKGQRWLPLWFHAEDCGATVAEAVRAGLDVSRKAVDAGWKIEADPEARRRALTAR